MHRFRGSFAVLVLAGALAPWTSAHAESGESTRVVDAAQHACSESGGYPYRAKAEYVLKELDLRPGDVVVDIGAGDGWWTERMAKSVGKQGVVHAAEVDQKKVDGMRKKYAGVPQIKPYLCKTDSAGLPENSCDFIFLSKTYHHLDEDGRVDYLRGLCKVAKTTGRLCVIEKYPEISSRQKAHATTLSRLVREAEQAGWILVRYELVTGTYHYLTIFVQQDLFPTESSS